MRGIVAVAAGVAVAVLATLAFYYRQAPSWFGHNNLPVAVLLGLILGSVTIVGVLSTRSR